MTVKTVKVVSIIETENKKQIEYSEYGKSGTEKMDIDWFLREEIKVGDQLKIIIVPQSEFNDAFKVRSYDNGCAMSPSPKES